MLTEISGILACKIIRTNGQTAHIPILLVCDFADQKLRNQAYKAGATDFIFKPIHLPELKAKLDLASREMGRSSYGEPSPQNLYSIIIKLVEEKKSGILSMTCQGKKALIYFQDGDIVDVRCGNEDPEKAFLKVISWSNTTYEFTSRTIDIGSKIESGAAELLKRAKQVVCQAL